MTTLNSKQHLGLQCCLHCEQAKAHEACFLTAADLAVYTYEKNKLGSLRLEFRVVVRTLRDSLALEEYVIAKLQIIRAVQ